LALALFACWASVGFGDTQTDEDVTDERPKRKAKRVVISPQEIKLDDETVMTIDGEEIHIRVEEALQEAEEALEEIEDDLVYRKVRRSDKVRVGENVYVDLDEIVNGDVVSVGGNVTVDGKVAGDVVSVLGNVYLENTAVVNGQVVAVFGRVVEEPGSDVRGELYSVGPAMFMENVFGKTCCPAGFQWRWLPLMSLISMVLLLVIALLVVLIFRDGIGRVNHAIQGDVLKSWLYGLLLEVILLVVTIVLTITVVGIPVAILLWLVVGLACLWAFAGVSIRVGEAITGQAVGTASRAGTLLIGGLVILSVPILARLLSLAGGMFWGPALGIRILGSLITWFALTTGLGAVVTTRFGTRDANGKAPVAAPAPPSGPEMQQA
jgi:hypothetical protein